MPAVMYHQIAVLIRYFDGNPIDDLNIGQIEGDVRWDVVHAPGGNDEFEGAGPCTIQDRAQDYLAAVAGPIVHAAGIHEQHGSVRFERWPGALLDALVQAIPKDRTGKYRAV